MTSAFKDFFKISVWHLVLLGGWLGSGVWFVSKVDSSVKALTETVRVIGSRQEALEKTQADIVRALDKINYTGSTVVQDYINMSSQRFNLFDSRITKLEEAINKMSAIYVDITWLKDHVTENFEDDKMLLKLLNEHVLNDRARSQSVK